MSIKLPKAQGAVKTTLAEAARGSQRKEGPAIERHPEIDQLREEIAKLRERVAVLESRPLYVPPFPLPDPMPPSIWEPTLTTDKTTLGTSCSGSLQALAVSGTAGYSVFDRTTAD